MSLERTRLDREKKTIAMMVGLFCRNRHRLKMDLCPECRELLDYANKRLDRCPFGAKKPVCSKCAVHCYQKGMREKIRQVMRFSGPRMLLRHPLMALQHYYDRLRW